MEEDNIECLEKKIFDYLTDRNINVYFPGQHEGECADEYVVIKDGGITSDFGVTGKKLIDIICYTPAGEKDYLRCLDFKKKIRKLMKVCPNVKFTGNETSIIISEENNGYTFSLLYENYKRI